ncbi:MAG TPA: NrfD/PsrC family molybdoenzyme membrane anchor subunit [Candidatus Baltobacteraceae bacterium]|jgi:formate-dependent nitrite reductase membrane component NrfD|nr:NrfD/PsrC family molybdoenzyme membrane anchor subunit [Candidatus Baltobacteraceae bacterium]
MKSYFNRPLLKKPHWEWEVVTYLFLGGVMGGSGMLAALAQRSEDEPLERTSRYLSLALSVAAPAVLISHLGRPERFLHMLRIVKLRSPMSMGVWGLVAYGTFSGFNAIAQLARDGILPRWIARLEPAPLTVTMQALFGAFTAGYTGVLLSATAIPLWAKGKYHIPAMSVCSAVAGACAINAIALCADPSGGPAQVKLERFEACAAAMELAILAHFRAYAGETGKPLFEEERGELLRSWTIGAGIVAPVLINAASQARRKHSKRPSVVHTLLAGVLTLAGGYVLRKVLIDAGKASADDPAQAFVQPE